MNRGCDDSCGGIELSEETVKLLGNAARTLNTDVRILLEAIARAVDLNLEFIKEETVESKVEFDRKGLEFMFTRLLDEGLMLRHIVRRLVESFDPDGIPLELEVVDWLEDFEGVFLRLYPRGEDSSVIDTIDLTLRKEGDGNALYRTIISVEDEESLDVKELVRKMEASIEEVRKTDEFEELEEDVEECCDYTEMDFNVLGDAGGITVELEVYATDWLCLPSISKVNRILSMALEKSGLLSGR